MAKARQQAAASQSAQAKSGNNIDWDFMKKYNYDTYDRLVHGNIAAHDSWIDNFPGLGSPPPGMGFGPPVGGPPRRH